MYIKFFDWLLCLKSSSKEEKTVTLNMGKYINEPWLIRLQKNEFVTAEGHKSQLDFIFPPLDFFVEGGNRRNFNIAWAW